MKKKLYHIPLIIIGLPAIIALVTWVVMLLWNWLMPVIFNLPMITFWQSLGLIILSKILLSSHNGHGGYNRRRNRDQWHKEFQEKLDSMSPEDKEHFMGSWKNRFESKRHDFCS